MPKLILPSKAQPGDEVTYELGTTEAIKAFVKCVRFNDTGEIAYDIAIELGPHSYTGADNVPSGCITVIKASAYQETGEESPV